MTYSHNHWASTETLRQLFSKMEGMVNEHTPGQDFAVLMDMAPIHISAETKQMLQEEFGHIRVIMIPQHNELLTALRCGVDAPIQEHDSKDGL